MAKRHSMVDITEITTNYLPISKKKARKFVYLYLDPKKIGSRIYVDREELEHLLKNPDRENFPLNI